MYLPAVVNSFGHAMRHKYGEKIHKVSINAAFTCPNRDGSKGIGGCSFCNNSSFSPSAKKPASIIEQIDAGQAVIQRRTGAKKYIAYFQAYTNTYAEVAYLQQQYDQALKAQNMIGLSVGTRPDCVPNKVLHLLADYQQQGHEVWLELGLQSALNESLQRVNRGHGFEEYEDAMKRARRFGLQVCTHLIVGLPGENTEMSVESHRRVIELGTQGLKLHPLHVVRHTLLAKQWKQGDYQAMQQADYINTACALIRQTPQEVVFHRLTATANASILLAPAWCQKKWAVLNAIYNQLRHEGARQGSDRH